MQDVSAAGADEAALTVEQKLLADAERLAASIQVRQDVMTGEKAAAISHGSGKYIFRRSCAVALLGPAFTQGQPFTCSTVHGVWLQLGMHVCCPVS